MKERPYTDRDVERFWRKVERGEDCWLWTASTSDGEYGQFRLSNPLRMVKAHRFSWVLAGHLLRDDVGVLHRCDTPRCVNPDHLFIGSVQDNMNDKIAKQRQAKGTKQGLSRLDEQQVGQIRRLFQDGVRQREIARRFGVNSGTVNYIVRGRTWKHV